MAGDAEFVLLINPDVQGLSGSYADVLEAFRHPRVGAVVARLLNSDGTLQPNCICAPRPFDLISEDVALAERFPNWRRPRMYRMLDWDHRDARPVDAARGACIFLRRAAIVDVGLFDEHFFVYYEETDWLIRAKRHGWRTVFLPTVEAVHASAGSSPHVRSPTQPPASRKPASLRPQALRGDDDRPPARGTGRNRHGTPRPPRAQPAEPTPERRRSNAFASTSRCARPGPRDQMEVSYTCSLDRVKAADWDLAGAASGARLRHTRVAAHLVASLREGPTSADRARTQPAVNWSRSCRFTSGGRTAFPCCGLSGTARATNSDPSQHRCPSRRPPRRSKRPWRPCRCRASFCSPSRSRGSSASER